MKETIKQKAVLGLEKRLGTICYIKRDDVEIPYTDGFTDGYQECEKDLQDLKIELDVMKAREKRIMQLEEQVEAMKCCENCKHYSASCCCNLPFDDCFELSAWELRK